MNVPTNAELEANAPDEIKVAIRGWLVRHTRSPSFSGFWTERELDWAANNFMIDPEIRGAHKKEFGYDYSAK